MSHFVHEPEPSEYLPAVHPVHTADVVAPVDVLDRPAPHATQSDAATTLLHDPAGHAVQAAEVLRPSVSPYKPIRQDTHAVELLAATVTE